MRIILTSLIALISFVSFGQSVLAKEIKESFRGGRFNAMVINVPFVDSKILEKALKNELKDWNGKYNSSKNEITVGQGTMKAIGIKPFDAIVKIIESKNADISFALAIDLGGAYLNSTDHKMQYETVSEKMRLFALRISKETMDDENKEQIKILTLLEKEEKVLIKYKEDLEYTIQDCEKKIEDAKKSVEQNIKRQEEKRNEIDAQKTVIEIIEEKLKTLK